MRASRADLTHRDPAFTLVEMLVVIGIIAILASLLLPAVRPGPAKKAQARLEIARIVQAINSYHANYSRYPVDTEALKLAATPNDFTYGGTVLAGILGPGDWTRPNSDAVAILMDLETDASGNATLNQGHVKNPQQYKLLEAKMVSAADRPGVGPDLVYRDPWGIPYVISLDVGYDDKCKDAFYCRQKVSQQTGSTGFNGLVNTTDPSGNGDKFLCQGGVMVWSLGPDRKADVNRPANLPPNRDNILSWAQ